MRHVSFTEAKQGLSRMLDAAQREPVVIQQRRRDVAVLLSMRDDERLTAMNIADFQDYCDRMSQRARERGLTEETLDTLLRDQG